MTDPYAPGSQVTPVWTPPPAQYGYGYRPPRPTNGMSIAAMVVSLVGLAGICFYGVVSFFVCPVGAILGHISRNKIKKSGEQGAGMALAGIIIGWVGFGLSLLTIGGIVAFIIWAENRSAV